MSPKIQTTLHEARKAFGDTPLFRGATIVFASSLAVMAIFADYSSAPASGQILPVAAPVGQAAKPAAPPSPQQVAPPAVQAEPLHIAPSHPVETVSPAAEDTSPSLKPSVPNPESN